MKPFRLLRVMAILAILALRGVQPAWTQFYATGEPPASIRWRQINTAHFKLIFPDGYEDRAREYASAFDQAYQRIGKQLDHFPKPVPVILHPQISRSNGLVIWAPKRMEIYPIPPQGIDAQPWRNQLVLHETRHVVQISKLNQGFTRFMSWFIGQQATGIATGLVPAWFLEGDAIFSETTLSVAGRGRNPSFEMGIKALLATDKKLYSYDKSLFGSYRDHVPNHYEYGYQLVSYGSELFGHEFWSQALDYTGKFPFVPFAFRTGMRRLQGIGTRDLYESAMRHRQLHWQKEDLGGDFAETWILSPAKKEYVNYYSPQFVSDSLLVALKDGPGFIRQIVLLKTGQEEKVLHIPGFLSANRISAGGNKIAWSETIPDLRWGNQSFSDIKVFDLDRQKEIRIGRQTSYYAPALSPDGTRIAAIENDVYGNCFLVVLDAESGEILSKVAAPDDSTLQFPAWSDEQEVLMTQLHSEGKNILAFNLSVMKWETLLKGGKYDLSNPTGNPEFIWFRSTWDTFGNIFCLERSSGTILKLTHERFGGFEPAVSSSEKSLVYANYTEKGYELKAIPLESTTQAVFDKPAETLQPFYRSQVIEPVTFKTHEQETGAYPAKPYKKFAHLFNIHSWAPFYFDFQNINPAVNQEIHPGISLLSQNILNTATGQFSYAWKNNNHFLSNRLTYSGSVTVIDLGMEYGDEPLVFSGGDTQGPGEIENDLLQVYSRFYIPMNLTSSRFISGMIPSLQVNYNNSYYYYSNNSRYTRGNVLLDWRFNYYRYLILSRRDISPRWGQQFRLRFYTSPFDKENLGSIFSTTGILYFPGLLKHHSLRISGSYQNQKPQRYLFVSQLEFPRGYEKARTEILHLLTVDYYLPLAYPDLTIPGILYLKRLRAGLFADMGINQYRLRNSDTNQVEWTQQNLSSLGVELLADYHFLRLLFPFSSGARITYLPYSGRVNSEVIFSINLNIF
jgi:hypothetical protein